MGMTYRRGAVWWVKYYRKWPADQGVEPQRKESRGQQSAEASARATSTDRRAQPGVRRRSRARRHADDGTQDTLGVRALQHRERVRPRRGRELEPTGVKSSRFGVPEHDNFPCDIDLGSRG
jgi:hypothetical protein